MNKRICLKWYTRQQTRSKQALKRKQIMESYHLLSKNALWNPTGSVPIWGESVLLRRGFDFLQVQSLRRLRKILKNVFVACVNLCWYVTRAIRCPPLEPHKLHHWRQRVATESCMCGPLMINILASTTFFLFVFFTFIRTRNLRDNVQQ